MDIKKDFKTTDRFFGEPLIDIDEQRTAPVHHRYVHGSFKDTDTRFSFYFPPKEQYRGRFFQVLEGGFGGSEHTLVNPMSPIAVVHPAFDLAFKEYGAYLVESNQGHLGNDLSGLKGDSTILYYRASRQTALLARYLATEFYGQAPHHGYVWGGSGGGHRTFLCMENSDGVWDGGVPYVISTEGITTMSVHAYAVEALGKDLASVIDATEPGGSGNPFEYLSSSQREALAVLYRAGWGRGGEAQLRRELIWGFGMHSLRDDDPTFFEDFWVKRGYAGADNKELLAKRLVQTSVKVTKTVKSSDLQENLLKFMAPGDNTVGIVVDFKDPDRLFLAQATIVSGAAKGRRLFIGGVSGDIITPFPLAAPDLFNGVEPGDEIAFDNRDYVAYCHYWMHTGTRPEQPYLGIDGVNIFPVRQRLIKAPLDLPGITGKFSGKMIYCAGTIDSNVFPSSAYERLVREHVGDKGADDKYRTWWMEHASHTLPRLHRPDVIFQTRLIDYTGYINQAVRHLVSWAEQGVAPPRQRHHFSRDNALIFPAAAKERGGIQPVVSLSVNGKSRAEVKAGEPVTLTAYAEVPPGAGNITIAEWDFDMAATWPKKDEGADGSSDRLNATVTHAYENPGTYFPCFRVGSAHKGVTGPPIYNLARCRVVVSS
jgi:hypothetical protein